jgi:hypothetical protein
VGLRYWGPVMSRLMDMLLPVEAPVAIGTCPCARGGECNCAQQLTSEQIAGMDDMAECARDVAEAAQEVAA